VSNEKGGQQIHMKCKICSRETDGEDFCTFHAEANENILRSYGLWKKGLKIPWKEYLREIRKNCLTGEWAKEVAEYLITNEEMQNDKKG
jgi:hypothetical protein